MYHEKYAGVSREFREFAAQYFGVRISDINESTRLDALQRDQHDLIRFSFAVEDHFSFEFPDGIVGKNGRIKECRANTIKTIGEYVKYIARLPEKQQYAQARARVFIEDRARPTDTRAGAGLRPYSG